MKKILILCLLLPVSGWSQVICSYSVNYDSASSLIAIDTLSTNIWQIGTPQKVPFMWSYSPPNVIVTDTINTYPQGNQSSFIFTIPAHDGQCNFFNITELTFWHKYETDSLLDLCIMEQSWNHGLTWYGLSNRNGGLDTFQCDGQLWDNDLDSLGNWIPITPDSVVSGSSNGWHRSKFMWIWHFAVIHNLGMPNYPDTILVRFTFKSDSIHNPKAGWMIDDMLVQHLAVGGVEELSGNNISVFPNPATNELTITGNQLSENSTVEIYDVVGMKRLTLNPSPKGEGLRVEVSSLAQGIYFVRLRTEKGIAVRKFVKQ